MKPEHQRFVDHFLNELRANNAAVFVGAGLSMPAGYVDWAGMLAPLAEEIGVDVQREQDLVSVAQYYVNRVGGRGELNQRIFEHIGASAQPTENHHILARLPIDTYWTINYDRLIERALEQQGKIADVKYTVKQLAVTKAKRDAVVYKMHGDAEHASETVVIRDDYEAYSTDREPFTTALSGDLVEKTFLFVGLSMSDPNINFVLSRVRRNFDRDRRRHYCTMKIRARRDGESEEDFRHAQAMQNLFVEDLRRYGVHTLLIDDYAQITAMLRAVERGYRSSSVMISGSAADYSPWSAPDVEAFVVKLVGALIQADCRIVTGFGLGIGNHVVTGALAEIFRSRHGRVNDHLVMRPFPFVNTSQPMDPTIWPAYRREMAEHAGVGVFLFGNKTVNDQEGPVMADGLIKEFDIALEQGVHPIPVGGTGWAAREIYERVSADFDRLYPNATAVERAAFETLAEVKSAVDEYIEPILTLTRFFKRGQ